MKFKFAPMALAFTALTGLALAGPATAQSASVTKEQVANILRENPEIVMEAIELAQAKQQEERQRALAEQAGPIARAIIAGDDQVAYVGNPDGTPIVEFYDYNCGFCKRFHNETAGPLVAEGGTKLLLVHTPILGDGSVRLAEFAAAANLQGKFEAAHYFLIEQSAPDVEAANKLIPELISQAGLDKAKFEQALADGSAKAQVEYNTELSRSAGVSGTPMVFANNQAIPGAIPLSELKRVLAN